MEMVLNRTFADRVSLPWDRLLRAVLILLLVGVLTSYIQKYVDRMEAGKETAKAVDTRSGFLRGTKQISIKVCLLRISEESCVR